MSDIPASSLPINEGSLPSLTNRFWRILPWLGLVFVLGLYTYRVASLHPTNFFGQMEDDSIYFSSAREIAQGRGYVMPNVPGKPPGTKYPILYPWILSWVWRLNPNFPANLSWAVALNVFFGLLYLASAFILLRRLRGLSDVAALILTAFCSLHPLILVLSADLMSDLAFAALTLMTCILASKATAKGTSINATLCCGLLSGLSILLRTLGVPVAFGLFLVITLRGGWRKSIAFAGSLLPFLSVLIGHSLFVKPAVVPMATSACANSWRMTWLYYTSYTDYWKADVLSNHVFWDILKNGIWTALIQPASYFVDPTGMHPALFAVVLLVFLSAVAIRGLYRQVQVGEWQPIHAALGFYLMPLLAWDYANFERFLMPFLPLIAAGMWIEGRHLIGLVRNEVRKQSGAGARIAAFFFMIIGFALVLGTALSWHRGTMQITRNSQARGALLEEKRQAYAWLREKTPAEARILAYEDVSSFLYTERETIRPTIFSPAGYYRTAILDTEISCILSSAEPIRASYWIVSDDDFGIEWEPARARALLKEREIVATLHQLFRSRQGRVRIYRLDSDGQPLP
jgi:4-amino-4-deoxy-L-arabinose transferase-like glycosyltransferase